LMKRSKIVKSVSIVRKRSTVQDGRGIPHIASEDPNPELRAHRRIVPRITITLPYDLTAAIAEWRMLQPGRPKARNRDRGVDRRWVGRDPCGHIGSDHRR
jgi:hypothetical protein